MSIEALEERHHTLMRRIRKAAGRGTGLRLSAQDVDDLNQGVVSNWIDPLDEDQSIFGGALFP